MKQTFTKKIATFFFFDILYLAYILVYTGSAWNQQL